MTGAERGFLLLTGKLGNPERKVLSTAQLRVLSRRMQNAPVDNPDRDLELRDLIYLGFGREMAGRILALLEEEELLDKYLRCGQKAGCVPITRISPLYPKQLRNRLGEDAPGCIWAKGDTEILSQPRISLVGSRDLYPVNEVFAREAGCQTAKQGFCLVSGNARGADRQGQEGALASGGTVISIVADALAKHPARDGVLYLSEDAFDEDFSAQRALSRNRCIHALGEKTLVAQVGYQRGGTWDGTVKNLRFGWSPIFCFDDGSPGARLLCQMGADGIVLEQLADLRDLKPSEVNFLGR